MAKPAYAKASAGEGGERGIRTPGPLTQTTVFKTAAFDRSAISPAQKYVALRGTQNQTLDE